jgi:hypothetical protein
MSKIGKDHVFSIKTKINIITHNFWNENSLKSFALWVLINYTNIAYVDH